MKKPKLIFHLIHIIFLLTSVVFLLYQNQLKERFGIQTFADYAVYWAVLGLVLYFVLWLSDVFETVLLKRKLKRTEAERNKAKAELYDITESKKPKPKVVEKPKENEEDINT